MKTRILFAVITAFASIPSYAVTRDPSHHLEFVHHLESAKGHEDEKTSDGAQQQGVEGEESKSMKDRPARHR